MVMLDGSDNVHDAMVVVMMMMMGMIIRDAVFPTFSGPSDFSPPPFFFPPSPVHVLVCVMTMRVNWWLSGQFWLRKSSSFCQKVEVIYTISHRHFPSNPLTMGLCPQTPGPRILSYFFEQSQWHPWIIAMIMVQTILMMMSDGNKYHCNVMMVFKIYLICWTWLL